MNALTRKHAAEREGNKDENTPSSSTTTTAPPPPPLRSIKTSPRGLSLYDFIRRDITTEGQRILNHSSPLVMFSDNQNAPKASSITGTT